MSNMIDWEAEIQETKAKATAAARHSERIVGGVSQLLTAGTSRDRQIQEIGKSLAQLNDRLGSLEATQATLHGFMRATQQKANYGRPGSLRPALIGVFVGVVASAVFFLN